MIPYSQVGVGSKGIIPMGAKDLEEALEMGMDWSLRQATYFPLLPFIVFSGRVTAGLKIRSIVRSMGGESNTRTNLANVELILYQGC